MLLNSTDTSKIHHLLMYECDSTVTFNDSNLPSDICENISSQIRTCMSNIATGWAVGGDVVSIRSKSYQLRRSNLNIDV